MRVLNRVCQVRPASALAFQLRRFSSGGGGVLVLADHDNTKLGASTLNAVTAAAKCGGNVSLLVAGANCDAVAQQAAKVKGVSRVLVADDAAYQHAAPEHLTALMEALQAQNKFSHIVGASTAVGKGTLPRLAAKLDVQPIADVLSVKSEDTFVRPIYAGNAISTVQSKDAVKVLTVRGTAFDAASATEGSAKIEKVQADAKAKTASEFVKEEVVKSERPDLQTARIVIAGGRGLKEGKNFEMLYNLADKLGAAVGASRAAVDAGFVSNELQIGQTGKVIAPDLYIGVGISGAIQHLAGMKDSKVIVVINKDPEAAFFQVADYGLVGDLFKVVPELDAALPAKAQA